MNKNIDKKIVRTVFFIIGVFGVVGSLAIAIYSESYVTGYGVNLEGWNYFAILVISLVPLVGAIIL